MVIFCLFYWGMNGWYFFFFIYSIGNEMVFLIYLFILLGNEWVLFFFY